MGTLSTTSRAPRWHSSREAGISLVEIMVGLVIGLIATAVILQTFSVSEGYKRNTTSAGDAQQNGLFSTFTLALELANAGNALATSATMLAQCSNVAPHNTVETTLRPIPVFIEPGATNDQADGFVIHYSASNTLVYPSEFLQEGTAPQLGQYKVQSPGGFKTNDMVIAMSGTTCVKSKVSNVSAADANGVVTITYSVQAPEVDSVFGDGALLLPMGPWDRVQRVRYSVLGGVLRSLDLSDPNAVAQPLASNIVNMKVQYGIDNTGDGILDTWVSAAPPWDENTLLGATLPVINQIKAIRIGIIVRGAQYDREHTDDFNWVLFDCPTHDNACPGRLTGTIAADAGGLGSYRYRVYETVVPLRNQLWNKQL